MAKPRSSRKWTATSVPRTSAWAPATNAGNGVVVAAADLPVGDANVVTGPCTASLALRALSRLRLASQQVLPRARSSPVRAILWHPLNVPRRRPDPARQALATSLMGRPFATAAVWIAFGSV